MNGDSPVPDTATTVQEGEDRPAKRRRSVVFGGELGPSGSTYGQKKKKNKGKGKDTAVANVEAVEDIAEEDTLDADDGESDQEDGQADGAGGGSHGFELIYTSA